MQSRAFLRASAMWACLTLASGAPAVAQSQSSSYRLEPLVLDAAGGAASGPSLDGQMSLGQGATVGASSSPSYLLQSGFWSFLGATPVPVVLSAARSGSTALDLTWSGNDASYDVYRSTGCTTPFANVLATTSSNAYADGSPPAASLVCYNVLAVAPGALGVSGSRSLP